MDLARTVLVTALAIAVPRGVCAADDPPSTALVHGGLALELSLVGVFALNFGTDLAADHPSAFALNFAPLVLAPLAAYGAHRGALDPRPALALHGGAWLGLELFMLGALVDGRDEGWGLRAGPVAWTLGALGAVAGGIAGATAVDDADAALAWMAAPVGGFVAGGIVLGGVLVLAGGADGDDAPGQLVTGALVGTAIGLGVAGYFALRPSDDPASTLRVMPQLQPGPRRMMVSFGGAF